MTEDTLPGTRWYGGTPTRVPKFCTACGKALEWELKLAGFDAFTGEALREFVLLCPSMMCEALPPTWWDSAPGSYGSTRFVRE